MLLSNRGLLAPRASRSQVAALRNALAPQPPLGRHVVHRRDLLFGSLVVGSQAVSGHQSANAAFVEEVARVDERYVQQTHEPSASTSGQGQPGSELNPPTFLTTTGRVVAIGDLHGDWTKAIEAFKVAGCIRVTEDNEIVWVGEDTVVVQLGDVLDRGDNEIAIVRLLRALDAEAREHGGAVYMLNGNHESLNICGDFRYVTPGAFLESAAFAGVDERDVRDWELLARVRYAVYKPGGPMAMELAKNPTVLVINDTVFAHGGLLPVHVAYGLERLNKEVSAWMRADKTMEGGNSAPPFLAMGDAQSVMWNRTFSKERYATAYDRYHACNSLKQALGRINASRLVVGHTPQLGGANCECDGRVWRIDVGMSYGVLNRPVQVLEIMRDPRGEASIVRVMSNQNQVPLEEMGSSVDL